MLQGELGAVEIDEALLQAVGAAVDCAGDGGDGLVSVGDASDIDTLIALGVALDIDLRGSKGEGCDPSAKDMEDYHRIEIQCKHQERVIRTSSMRQVKSRPYNLTHY